MPFYHLSELGPVIGENPDGQTLITQYHVIIQARIYKTRPQGNMAFAIVREGIDLLQVIGFKKTHREVFDTFKTVPRETLVRITGQLKRTPMVIEDTGKRYELHATQVEIISPVIGDLPIQVLDLNQVGETIEERQGHSDVMLHNRLNHRTLDLRSIPNHLLFKTRTYIEACFRETLSLDGDFIEIHSPKLIAIPSESGAEVFPVTFFKQQAYLAQSPQLYKQMAINSDFYRVFEIGPVFRAEPSISRRHLCEFTGLDLEMVLNPTGNLTRPYYQVFQVVSELFLSLESCLGSQLTPELKQLAEYFPGPAPVIPAEIPVITFQEGVAWLNEVGYEQDPQADLKHDAEAKLGDIVRDRLNSDLFFLINYPSHLRPFYTMRDPENPSITRSYDLIFRGQEIASGAQREHRYDVLKAQMEEAGLTLDHYQDYLNSFKYGSHPHAGIGIGLERLVALYLNIPDVHYTSLFPRDPTRLTP